MPVTIKRYPNRKLYDTKSKRYITLDEIGHLIREDVDIIAIDSVSGEIITTYILTQVILAQEKQKTGKITQGLLAGLIRANEEKLDLVRQLLHDSTGWIASLLPPGIPSRDDVDKLASQIEDLTDMINEIVEKDKK